VIALFLRLHRLDSFVSGPEQKEGELFKDTQNKKNGVRVYLIIFLVTIFRFLPFPMVRSRRSTEKNKTGKKLTVSKGNRGRGFPK
jgi:hypothetical protein